MLLVAVTRCIPEFMTSNRAANAIRIIVDPASKHVKAGTSQRVTPGEVTVGLNGSVFNNELCILVCRPRASFELETDSKLKP